MRIPRYTDSTQGGEGSENLEGGASLEDVEDADGAEILKEAEGTEVLEDVGKGESAKAVMGTGRKALDNCGK